MSKHRTKEEEQREDAAAFAESPAAAGETVLGQTGKLGRKEYEREMRRLHGELVAMQEWRSASSSRVVIPREKAARSGGSPSG